MRAASGPQRRAWIRPTTLGDLLDSRAEVARDREGLVFPGKRITFGEFAQEADATARALVAAGVRQGDHVGLLLNASTENLAVLFGAAKIGAVPVPINTRSKGQELSQVVAHGRLRVLVTTGPEGGGPDFPALLEDIYPAIAVQPAGKLALAEAPLLHTVVQLAGETTRSGLLSGASFVAAGEQVPPVEIEALQACVRVRDTAIILYTSGTSSAPKGVMISHEALTRMAQALATTRLGLGDDDRMWTTLPFFHVGGIAFVLACLTGGSALVHVGGFFDPVKALDVLEREHCTVAMGGFDTIWLAVITSPGFAKRDLSAVTRLHSTGAPDKLRQIAAAFPDATFFSNCGMTENCGMMSWAVPTDPPEVRTETGGPLMPGVQARTVDPETGADCPPGVPGELLIRGAFLFSGYFREPELNATVFDEEGWFRTGDLMVFDDRGHLSFVSRLKDMLKVGGENVAAAEVESCLLSHPAVELAQVVGAPDAYYTEVPAAYVQLVRGATLTEEELIAYCRGRIAGFRVPRYVRFVTRWPMSSTKIKKNVLREWIAAELMRKGITEAPRVQMAPASTAG